LAEKRKWREEEERREKRSETERQNGNGSSGEWGKEEKEWGMEGLEGQWKAREKQQLDMEESKTGGRSMSVVSLMRGIHAAG
jgi:hypothetical protein